MSERGKSGREAGPRGGPEQGGSAVAARSSSGAAGGEGPAYCVLWHAPGCPPPARLRDALGRREIRVVLVEDPFRAVAEVCRLSRHAEVSALILLLVEPTRLTRPADAVRSVRSYVPEATCWRFAAGVSPELGEVGDADLSAWSGGSAETGGGPGGSRPEAPADAGRPSGWSGGGRSADQASGPYLKLVDPDNEPEPGRRDESGGEDADISEIESPDDGNGGPKIRGGVGARGAGGWKSGLSQADKVGRSEELRRSERSETDRGRAAERNALSDAGASGHDGGPACPSGPPAEIVVSDAEYWMLMGGPPPGDEREQGAGVGGYGRREAAGSRGSTGRNGNGSA